MQIFAAMCKICGSQGVGQARGIQVPTLASDWHSWLRPALGCRD